MKRILTILLTISIVFTFTLGSAFADDGAITEPQADVPQVEETETVPEEVEPVSEEPAAEVEEPVVAEEPAAVPEAAEPVAEEQEKAPVEQEEIAGVKVEAAKLDAPSPDGTADPEDPADPTPDPQNSPDASDPAAPAPSASTPAAKKVKVAKVTGIKAKTVSSSKIKVTWKKVSGAKGYKVYRYNNAKKRYYLLKTIKSGKTVSLTDTGLKSGTKYYYKVAAYKGSVLGQKSTYAKATTSYGIGSRVASIAKRKLGCSYRSGHVGPRSFDCSGFVYYVFNKAKAGKVRFKRSTAQGEYNQLKKYRVGYSIKNAKKGDILFFSSSGKTRGIYHTGIYLGNGKMIHAANPRKGVCIAKTKWVPRVCAVVRLH